MNLWVKRKKSEVTHRFLPTVWIFRTEKREKFRGPVWYELRLWSDGWWSFYHEFYWCHLFMFHFSQTLLTWSDELVTFVCKESSRETFSSCLCCSLKTLKTLINTGADSVMSVCFHSNSRRWPRSGSPCSRCFSRPPPSGGFSSARSSRFSQVPLKHELFSPEFWFHGWVCGRAAPSWALWWRCSFDSSFYSLLLKL